MSGDSLGKLFKISNFGESHGKALGVLIEGCPPGTPIDMEAIQRDMDRRRPGQSKLVTQRREADSIEILSGVKEGLATGTPIAMMVFNQDQRTKDYGNMAELYRPSHADYTYDAKYGLRDIGGGGRSSARVTLGSVAAGAVAKTLLKERFGLEINAWVERIHDLTMSEVDPETISQEKIESNAVRCPDPASAEKMSQRIVDVRKAGDSIGGVIRCYIKNVPPGLGEPIYDKLEADLAKAMLGINATKGFEIGSGFEGSKSKGSEHNDVFYNDDGTIRTRTNRSGGVQGGISNGMPIDFRVAFKPTATIIQEQETVDKEGNAVKYFAKGRHDACVLPRAVPIVEAMAALVLCDHSLRQKAIQ